jgi:hypothetical protein
LWSKLIANTWSTNHFYRDERERFKAASKWSTDDTS